MCIKDRAKSRHIYERFLVRLNYVIDHALDIAQNLEMYSGRNRHELAVVFTARTNEKKIFLSRHNEANFVALYADIDPMQSLYFKTVDNVRPRSHNVLFLRIMLLESKKILYGRQFCFGSVISIGYFLSQLTTDWKLFSRAADRYTS